MQPCRIAAAGLLLTLLSQSSPGQLSGESESDLSARYGFDGLIISAFNDGLFGLCAGDVDGDGVSDLALVNNAKARIELLLHRDPGQPEDAAPGELVNKLPDEAFFRRIPIPVEQKLWALLLHDFDGDGRADLLFSGDSGELTLLFSRPDEEWSQRLHLPLDHGSSSASSLAVGDLDGDGAPDVVALAGDELAVYLADGLRSLAAARLLPNASPSANALHLADVDGDDLLDLLLVVEDSETPLRLRRGRGGASFGPELRSPLPPLRSHSLADVDGDGSAEVLAVARLSGRAMLIELARDDRGGAGQAGLCWPLVSPLPGSGRRTPLLTDLDGDGLLDLLVAEPEAARLVFHRGGGGDGFGTPRSWPSLLGSDWPAVADLDGDGLPEVLIGASDEQALALAQVDADGALAFPEIVGAPGGQIDGLALGDLDGDGAAEAWLLSSEGRGRKREHHLERFEQGRQTLDLPLAGLPADPSGLVIFDLDRDGRLDLIVCVPTEAPRLLLSTGADPAFEELDADGPGLGILKGVAPEALVPCDVDGDGLDELLVPSANFARALFLDDQGRPQVVAQFNLDRPGAKVGAACVADLDGDGRVEVLLHDASSSELVVLEQDLGVARERGRLPLTDLQPQRLLPADLDGDGDDDLVIWGKQRFATLLAGGTGAAFATRADYESPVEDAFLTELAAGDLNGDGGTDLVLLETRKHLLHLAALEGDRIRHALRFEIFEGRLFESARHGSREPREVLLADVTGDGLLDVALLVHDRLIVYPQEAAPMESPR